MSQPHMLMFCTYRDPFQKKIRTLVPPLPLQQTNVGICLYVTMTVSTCWGKGSRLALIVKIFPHTYKFYIDEGPPIILQSHVFIVPSQFQVTVLPSCHPKMFYAIIHTDNILEYLLVVVVVAVALL